MPLAEVFGHFSTALSTFGWSVRPFVCSSTLDADDASCAMLVQAVLK
jgi:hypothetical protein